MTQMMGHSVPSASSQMKRNLGGVFGRSDRCAAIQKDVNRLENWADKNFMQYSEVKYQVLHFWRNIPMHQYVQGATWLGRSFAEKNLAVLVDAKSDHEPAMCYCSKEGHQPPGLQQEEHYLQVKHPLFSVLECCIRIKTLRCKRYMDLVQ